MKEDKVIERFEKVISSYKFATHLEKERTISSGRVDIHLPDYSVVIEAKGDSGYLKKAIGQSLVYSKELDAKPYILSPFSMLNKHIVNTCEDNEVGILVVPQLHNSVKIVNNVGGLEAFSFYAADGPYGVNKVESISCTEKVLGA